MEIKIEETEGGYKVTVVFIVKHWLELVSEIKQIFKLKELEGQED